MKRFAAALLAGALLIPAGFAADRDSKTQHMDPYMTGPQEEGRLIKEVRHQLVMLPYYGIFDDLGFNVNGGTVTLTGAVTRPTLKSDAGNVVKRVEGVTNVVNNIEVLPLSPDDDRIRMATYRAIYGDPALADRYGYRALPSIHIIVRNGQVRLEGVVANTGDKNIAGIRANGVSGAFSVQNDLMVEGK
ncbi:MAG: BON domain-containing protein [Acidobacteriota bacterium]|nr:BON domain-containing protein [Acidobacteriota bacterium]